jgi:glycosyltransferase involved in cell wall biosynthesis
MVSELLKNKRITYNLLYFDYKGKKNQYLNTYSYDVTEKIIRIPYRILTPFWKKLSFPKLESITESGNIFYTNEFYFPPTKKSIILATIHGLAYKIIPHRLPSKVIKSLNQGLSFILKHADYLVAVSETTKEELITKVGVAPERIYVVTHGVDQRFRIEESLPAVLERLKKKYGISRPYVLFVGAIGIHKNIMGILKAYKILSQDTVYDLVLAGPQDSAWVAAKQFICEHNLSNRVHFLGHIFDTEKLVDLYNGANLFVFPSFYEGWTSPPLEAMACGTPVITSNCSSLPETVGDAAIKVNPDSSEELAHEMNRVLNDGLLRNTLIEKGLTHIESHTWANAASKMMQVFTDIKMRGPWKEPII